MQDPYSVAADLYDLFYSKKEYETQVDLIVDVIRRQGRIDGKLTHT